MKSQPLIPTYIINLKKREDRKINILNEFAGRNEFDVTVVEAYEHAIGAVGLWNTIKHIVQNLADQREEYILICEDDHQFTEHYSKELLYTCLTKAKEINADILSGGVSWFKSVLQISNELFWVERFTGTQFIIVFKSFYSKIKEVSFEDYDAADQKICDLSNNILFIYPFISNQREFGYSDATTANNIDGRVERLFKDGANDLEILKGVQSFYQKRKISDLDPEIFNDVSIPTYVINIPERIDRRTHICKQFEGRNEFNITIVEAIKHRIGAVGQWQSIRKVIEMAVDNDDDVIIICEDDHEFTADYTKAFLIKNIIEAHNQDADLISGGAGSFNHIIPVTINRYWIRQLCSTQFIIVYKKFFNRILEEPFDDTVIADMLLSEMTSNKMLLFPFVSIERDFGYSDINPHYRRGLISYVFNESSRRLNNIRKILIDQRILK